MANWSDPRVTGAPLSATAGTQSAATDAGLRSYMLSVYNYMACGVLLSAGVAMFFASNGLTLAMMGSPIRWLVMLAPLGFVMVMSFGQNKMSTAALQACFWAFSAVMGMSLSTILLVYSGTSVAQTFLATAASFAGLSLFGYTTKKDLSGMGTFLIMGLIGLLVVTLINMFVQSSALQFGINLIGVLIFAGLTAYDTQRIKSMYAYVAGSDMVGKTVVMSALSLYLDFINMFQFLLSFMGSRD